MPLWRWARLFFKLQILMSVLMMLVNVDPFLNATTNTAPSSAHVWEVIRPQQGPGLSLKAGRTAEVRHEVYNLNLKLVYKSFIFLHVLVYTFWHKKYIFISAVHIYTLMFLCLCQRTQRSTAIRTTDVLKTLLTTHWREWVTLFVCSIYFTSWFHIIFI